MQIDERTVGDVVVLTWLGKITLGEGDELIKDKIDSLLNQGRTRIVVDLADVPYIDSSGLGETVRTITKVSRAGGRIVFCNPTKRIIDLWSITKLITVIPIAEDVNAAIASFGAIALEVSCPMCRPPSWMSWASRLRLVSCTACDARFLVEIPELHISLLSTSATHATTRVSYLWWQTYYENGYGPEQVQLKFGRPCTISVSGRLDLFAIDLVLRAWEAVRAPKRVVLDTAAVRYYSQPAVRKLLEMCGTAHEGSRAVVLWRRPDEAGGTPADTHQALAASPFGFTDLPQAVAALGDATESPQSIEVGIRRGK